MESRPCALVTGASGGLGAEFSRILAAQGNDLVLVARSESRLRALAAELEDAHQVTVHVCPADLSREDAAEEVFAFTEARGLYIDVLVNNAGFGDNGPFHVADWQRQRDMVQVNVVALMQLCRLFAGPMVARGHGRILNLSSVAAFSAGPGMSVYYASKAFVLSFSEALHEELAGTGVTVTALCPGPTSTGFAQAAKMGSAATMFRHAADAQRVARDGIAAMEKGKAVCLQGAFTKVAAMGSRFIPRALARRFAGRMDR